MANYSLVANTQFKARSFDDLLRPYAMYTQEYRAQEDALAELATKADVWQGLANEQTDPVAYAQYTNYANALKDQAKIIADRGLDPGSRQAVLNLRRRYASEITPIEQAYTARKAQAEEQRKALLQNPTLMLSRRADTTSLDRYLENQNLGYDSYSGALLTQQAGQAAAAIAKELRDYGKGKPLDGFTKTWLQQHGYSAGEVAFAINNPNDPRASKVLNTIVDNVMADSGMSNWADNATLNQAYNYARQGLWQAVGQTQVTPYEDKAAVMAAQYNYDMSKLRTQRQWAKQDAEDAAKQTLMQNTLGKINPTNLYSTAEETKYKDINSKLKKYSQYFTFDKEGNIQDLSDRGKNFANAGRSEQKVEYNAYKRPTGKKDPKTGKDIYSGTYSKITWKNQEFRDLLKSLGFDTSDYIKRGPRQTESLKRIAKEAAMDYDATRTTVFTHDYDPSEYKAVHALIGRAAGTSDVDIVDYDSKKKQYVPTNKTFSTAKLGDKDDQYSIIASRGSSKGLTYIVRKNDGTEQFEIVVPGVNREQEKAARNAYARAEQEAAKYQSASTPWEQYTYQTAYENALWAAEQALGNTVYRNKTKVQEFQ